MWLCPVVRITMMWSAPFQAAIRMRRMSSSKCPEAISEVITGAGCGSMPSKYFAVGIGTLFFSGSDMFLKWNPAMSTPPSGTVRQVQPLRGGW